MRGTFLERERGGEKDCLYQDLCRIKSIMVSFGCLLSKSLDSLLRHKRQDRTRTAVSNGQRDMAPAEAWGNDLTLRCTMGVLSLGSQSAETALLGMISVWSEKGILRLDKY